MSPPVISVVAKSGSGKTTFLEKLIPALKARGLHVGVLKHHSHDTPFDAPGKDTYRHFAAGADVVVGLSNVQIAVFRRRDETDDLEKVMREQFAGLDLVLTEGFKRGPFPKIEVHRAARSAHLLCDPADLLALISDEPFALATPQFGLDDVAAVADFILDWLADQKRNNAGI